MPLLNRRAVMLGGGALSGVAIAGAAAAALSIDEGQLPHTAQQRFDHHLAGLKAAARELNPEITAWAVGRNWGIGGALVLVGTEDRHLSYGGAIGGLFPIDQFKHDRLGTPPTFPYEDHRLLGFSERQKAKEAFYGRWLGRAVLS